ncbi:ABC transporter substrate-binding protein [Actinopolymorpha pittospori]|uniref:Peptide/nickel transport system substrate-binding protein n=1 Tax=Actinopolymorpha pittospori TaxID=648752 RepID=A0A927MUP7_9ACTN|nr:ABC transporter substrate-binding protein [Actinopolymorpha pittospori]MBE1603642.1 peptide/nickel transport system substrate-binding protein [Actinopolymorpha pittospori]
MLAGRVKSGDLPPVAERLPVLKDIMVEPVHEQIGKYGGTWNFPTGDWQNGPWDIGKPTEEALFRFNPQGDGVEPNVAKGFEVNDNLTEYTIQLREGMKWSDGHPFTSADVMCWWDSIMVPKIFGREVYDAFWSTDPKTGERALAEFEAIDDLTVRVTFKHPRPVFLERVAIDAKWMFAPAHWMERILDEFIGKDAALKIAKERGFQNLVDWYESAAYYYWFWPDRPSLRAWLPTAEPGAEQITWERNPYYWKTDPAGNQLPYIDELSLEIYQDPSHVELQVLNGHFDIAQFEFPSFTLLQENRQKGDYRVIRWDTAEWYSNGIQFNMEPKDANMRTLFHDPRFREALSVAVDRKALSEQLTLGFGLPQQGSIAKGRLFYQKGWAEKWAAYDVDHAKALLDEIGLPLKGQVRTHPDGSELRLTITQESEAPQAGQFEELLKHYFEAIGIQTDVQLVDGGLFGELNDSAGLQATTTGSIGGIHPIFRPDTVVPLRAGTPWHNQYGTWYASGGTDGVEPEGDIMKLITVYREMSSQTEPDAIDEYAEKIVQLHMKNQWAIGYTGTVPRLFSVSNNIANVPEQITFADEFRDLGHGRPAQFTFIDPDADRA